MKKINELIDPDDPGIRYIKDIISKSSYKVELLSPSKKRESILEELQVTNRSTLGAIVYDTGGIIVDGWIRFLGSGHERFTRDIIDWNKGRSSGYLLIADDVSGGFFALNGGGLGDDVGNIYYWPADSLEWEALEIGYTDFFAWSLTERIEQFYADLGKTLIQKKFGEVDTNRCIGFIPFLWTEEGSPERSRHRILTIAEVFKLKFEFAGDF